MENFWNTHTGTYTHASLLLDTYLQAYAPREVKLKDALQGSF